MKRSLFTAMAALLVSGTLLAGGIVTNTNQSAMYTRMAARQATVGIDAVYYNPAGLTKLENGFHFSVNNQTIGQTRTITSNYQYLNDGKYAGEVSASIFPGIYGVFKVGKLAISAGFNPIGGGGGATYNRGLPSFEYQPADLVPALQAGGQNVTAYRMNTFFEGTSTFFGYQANVSYAINDMISVAIGGRFVTAKETYSGYLKDIAIQLDGTWIPASDFFEGAAAQYDAGAASLAGAATALQPAIDGGLGDVALSDPFLIGTLDALGLYQAGMTNAQAQATFQGASAAATASAQETAAAGALLEDQDVDAERTGSGFTPIVSIHVQPIEMLNIAVKYEHLTKLELTNKTVAGKAGVIGVEDDGTPIYLFPDGAKTNLDMPALLQVGATLRPIESLLLSTGFTYYFDKNANWDGREELVDDNSWDLSIGAEYYFGEKLLASAGYSMTQTGVSEAYQTDLSYSLSTNAISFGIGWNIIPNLQLNVGAQLVSYQDDMRNFQHDFASSGLLVPVKEDLQMSVWVIGAGLNFSIAR